jgi:hypothetical protein
VREEDKEEIVRLIQEASEPLPEKEPSTRPEKPPRKPRARKKPGVAAPQAVTITGNGNNVAGRDINHTHIRVTSKTTKVEVPLPPNSIGGNPLLRQRIEYLFKQINEYRYERLGKKYRFGAIHGELAKEFGLKSKDWKQMWLWPEARADAVIKFLEDKRDNTQQGRIEKAATREGYRHTRPHLFRIEKECLDKLEWDGTSDEVRDMRYRLIGKASRAEMSYDELARWVAYLQGEVKRFHGEWAGK